MVAQEGEYPMNGWVVVWCARVKLAYGHICMHAGIMQCVLGPVRTSERKRERGMKEGVMYASIPLPRDTDVVCVCTCLSMRAWKFDTNMG